MNDVMIDIETLGTGPFSHILSITAIKFDRETGKKKGHLYLLIDPESCQKLDLLIEASTVIWWMKQPDVSRNEFAREDVDRIAIVPALESLSEFISSAVEGVNIWAQEDCWHWIMRDPVLYKYPFLNVKGRLGLWDYEY